MVLPVWHMLVPIYFLSGEVIVLQSENDRFTELVVWFLSSTGV